MILNDVHQGVRKNTKPKRIGRGPGSGTGKTSARGHKGAGSRAGFSMRLGFEGGQMPITRKVAKRGFSNNYFSPNVAIVNLRTLEENFESGAEVTPDTLVQNGLVKGQFDAIKILGEGELTKKLTVKAHRFSSTAEQKILAAGGRLERIYVV